MYGIINTLDQLQEKWGRRVSYLSLILVLIVVLDVVLRYFFNTSFIWMIELEWHIFGLLFLWSMAYTLRHDEHVRVDVFYQRWPSKTKRRVNALGHVIFLLPWSYIVIHSASLYAYNAFVIDESSADPSGLPMRWLIKMAIVIGFVLLALQAVLEIFKEPRSTNNN